MKKEYLLTEIVYNPLMNNPQTAAYWRGQPRSPLKSGHAARRVINSQARELIRLIKADTRSRNRVSTVFYFTETNFM